MTDVNDLIVDHLDIWTTALEKKSGAGRGNGGSISLYGINKLRELILELAIRGKLVPQEPTDDNAANLVALFKEEKRLGIKDKRYKNQKVEAQPTNTEALFVVPENWAWARIGDIGFAFNGNSVSSRLKKEKYSTPTGLPFVATKDIGYGFQPINHEVDTWIPEGEPKFKPVKSNVAIICSEGGSAGKKCGMTTQEICFGNKLFACDPYGDFCSKYLLAYYQTPTFFSEFSRNMTGIIGGISLGNFLNLPVPIPPLAEQRRIIAKVDELMALCDALEAQTEDSLKAHQTLVETCLATLTNSQSPDELIEYWSRVATHFDTLFTTKESVERLKTAILELAIQGKLTARGTEGRASPTEIVTQLKESQAQEGIKPGKRGKRTGELTFETNIPENWQRIELQDLALQITDGTHLTPKYTDEGRPFLSAKNVKPFEFLPDNHRYVSEEDFEGYRQNRKPVSGDILMTRVGAGIGEAAVIDSDMEFAIYVSVCLIKPFTKYLMADYLCLWLNSPEGRALSTEKTYGRGASQGNLNLEFIRTFSIPLPPLREQTEIVKNARALLEICDVLLLRIDHAQRVQASLADTLCSNIH